VLPAGYRLTTAEQARPEAAVRAHLDAWAPSEYMPGAPAHANARGLYYGLGFRELSRDAPLVKPPR